MPGKYQIWLSAFLARRHLTAPDARSLYAYRCSTEEFDSLWLLLFGAKILISEYTYGSLHRTHPELERLFVLYSAEWWRRNYYSGPWKWQPIIDTLNWPDCDLKTRTGFVEQGLRYWKRPLLQRGDQRGFLLSIACEGGLPINLIRNDSGYLRTFLRNVLRDYATYGSSGADATELAGNHLDSLPTTLRQPVVQELAGILIESIWKLQSRITENRNPLEELDRLEPSWRQQLPVVLEDQAANSLVSALIQQARKMHRGTINKLRIVRRLIRNGESWRLQAELLLPDSIDQKMLNSELGDNHSLGERLELWMSCAEKFVHVASLVKQNDEYNVYPHDRRHLHIRENAEQEINCFIYKHAQQTGQLSLPNGSSLTEGLPLVFVDFEGDGHALDLCGQGSLSSRFPEVYVLATSKPETVESNHNDHQSEIVAEHIKVCEGEASLYKLRGKFKIALDEATVCSINTSQAEELRTEYRIDGQRNYLVETQWPVFVGVPSVRRIHENGNASNVRAEELYWSKAVGKRNWWKITEVQPRGLIELRHVRNRECLFAHRIVVLPRDMEIKLVPANKGTGGKIELHNIDSNLVGWQEQEDLKIEKNVVDNKIVLHCSAEKAVPGKISLKLGWQEGTQCDLDVPYPIEGGRFVTSEGRVIGASEYLGLEDLYGCSAIGLSLHGERHFKVHGKLKADDINATMQRTLDFEVQLPKVPGNDQVYDLPLYELHHMLQKLFNFSSDLDAIVTLELMRQGCSEARIGIRQFSAKLKFNVDSQKLYVESDKGKLVSALNNEPLELLPLFDPETASRWLQIQEDKNLSWLVPREILERGPWLAVAPERVRRYCRPRLLLPSSPPNSSLAPAFGLREIIALPDAEERIQNMYSLFERMAADINHQEWSSLVGYVERFASVNPNCLDWLVLAVEHPRILVGLLLMRDTRIFDIVYEWQEGLPFKWWMLPIHDWEYAIRNFLSTFETNTEVREILAKQIEKFLERVDERNLLFSTTLEYLKLHVLGCRSSTNVMAEVATDGIDKSWRKLESISLVTVRREKGESHWPVGVQRDEWGMLIKPEHQHLVKWLSAGANYQHSILDAPFAAAYLSVTGQYPKQSHRAALTAFRDFHQDWFDTAFRAVQAILLTQLGKENRHE